MKLARNIFSIAAILMISACSNTPQLTEDQKTTISLEVKETLNNYYHDIKESGLTAEFKYLDNSKDFFWIPPGYAKPLSYDSVATILKLNAGNYKEIDNSFENLTIEAVCIDTAIYSGRIRSIITDTTGTPMTMYLNEKGKLIKRADGWKLLSGETTLSLTGK